MELNEEIREKFRKASPAEAMALNQELLINHLFGHLSEARSSYKPRNAAQAEQQHLAAAAAEHICNNVPLDDIEQVELEALCDWITFHLFDRFWRGYDQPATPETPF
jgi:hypothetical protein